MCGRDASDSGARDEAVLTMAGSSLCHMVCNDRARTGLNAVGPHLLTNNKSA